MAMGIWPWLQQPHWYLQVFHYSRGAERQGQIYWTIHLQWRNALIHDKQNPLRGPTLINLYSGNKQIWMYWEMRRWKKQQIKNFMCPRVYLVMLILNQVVSMSFLEREKHRGVTSLVLSLGWLWASYDPADPSGPWISPNILKWSTSPWAPYRERFEVFVPLLFIVRVVTWAQLVVDPLAEVPDRLGAGDNVKRRGQSGSFIKVTHPELRPCEFPLNVRVVLWEKGREHQQLQWGPQSQAEEGGVSSKESL